MNESKPPIGSLMITFGEEAIYIVLKIAQRSVENDHIFYINETGQKVIELTWPYVASDRRLV